MSCLCIKAESKGGWSAAVGDTWGVTDVEDRGRMGRDGREEEGEIVCALH